MKQKIEKALDAIRPSLQADGGDIEFVSFDEINGVLEVRLQGRCAHRPMAAITLKDGVEVEVKKMVPEVKKVLAV